MVCSNKTTRYIRYSSSQDRRDQQDRVGSSAFPLSKAASLIVLNGKWLIMLVKIVVHMYSGLPIVCMYRACGLASVALQLCRWCGC
ncbi:hypothetical protein F5Y00DRAFT_58420 [Daldinia vernicosa]|uniref:uncharacterized protein n=1 Tax=Daldinia vernicosa TaxID=114800 RepID=UPI0020074EFF|nr:uncharacterized protein F5Y00DRAFT_58420 [Daldinia vernicosa]KAI0853711.1 hypothetical protein F5Y00DRAFT_58420 [Daldinia vernicosa]